MKLVNPYRIRPPHPIFADDTYKIILKSMKTDGWVGRPLVVAQMNRNKRWDYSAITGSHRIRAARKAGITVPIEVLPHEFLKDSLMADSFSFWDIYCDASSYLNKEDSEIPWQKYPVEIVELLAEDIND